MGSILKPDTSVMVGVSTAALVGFTYNYGVPNVATISATKAQDHNVESGRRKAAWTSAAVVAIIALMTRDKTVFVLGGMTIIALDLHARLGNATDPRTGKLVSNGAFQPAADEPADMLEPAAFEAEAG